MAEKKYVIDNAQLMAEWDLEKNLTLGFSPNLISLGSGRSVWWLCSKGHSYQMTVHKKLTEILDVLFAPVIKLLRESTILLHAIQILPKNGIQPKTEI